MSILTDKSGRPFGPKPRRADGEDVGAFLVRLYAWKQAITNCANDAFDAAFRAAMREP